MLVYTPAAPAIHYLNPLAWLVFELCMESTSHEDTVAAFLRLNKDRIPGDEARRRCEAALDRLVADGLVLRTTEAIATPGNP